MIARATTAIGRLQDPRYTGSNRCTPCTILNGIILLLLAGLLTVINPIFGFLALLMGILLIALRGYLIPGTPRITARYVPAGILQFFDHDRKDDWAVSNEGFTLEALLLEADAVEECGDGDLCMTEGFREEWSQKVHALDGGIDVRLFADAIGLETDAIERRNGLLFIERDAGRHQQWGSKLAIISDTASAAIMQSRLQFWEELPIEEKRAVLEGLRIFIDECPVCDHVVSIEDEETTIGCCQRGMRYVVRCENCDDILMKGEPVPN